MTAIAKSKHIGVRQQQRGLRQEVLEFVLDFGHVEFGAGAVWYHVRQRALPSYLRGSKIADMAKRWTVVVSGNNEKVLTAYARKDASRHVHRKCRRRRGHAGCDKQGVDYASAGGAID